MSLKEEETDTGGEGHVKIQAETGVMHPQAKATTGRKERHRGQFSPSESLGATNSADTLTLDSGLQHRRSHLVHGNLLSRPKKTDTVRSLTY